MLDDLSSLSITAREFASSKPPHWEHLLFAQVLIDEVDAAQSLILTPIISGRINIPMSDSGTWYSSRIDVLQRIDSELKQLIQRDHTDAWGPPGVPGDVHQIVVFARQIAMYYRQVIEWVHSVRNADVEPNFRQVAYEASFLADPWLNGIAQFGRNMMAQLEAALRLPPETKTKITAALTINAPNCARVDRAIEAALRARTEPQQRPSANGPGYIYILSNPSLGNLLKIGMTRRSSRDRVAELSLSTSSPTPFVLAFDAYVEDCLTAEQLVHEILERDGFRVSSNREFFNVDLTSAVKVVLEAQKRVAQPRVDY